MGNSTQKYISDDTADRLIAAHDGDVALLYLWLARNGDYDAEKAAGTLCRTLRETEAAFEKLSRMGLAEAKEKPPARQRLEPAEELPQYSSKEITGRAQTDPDFHAVLSEAESRFGRMLSAADIKTLFGIYDYLGLPADVIFMLLTYCFERCTEKYGKGRQPSMRTVEKEAYAWARREILTVEQAEDYIKSAAERRSETGRILAALGITGRNPTPTEAKYIGSWIDMGFHAEVLEIAFDRTVTNTGSLKWNYMDKIVRNWNEMGVKTPQDVEEKDGYRQKPQSGQSAAPASGEDLGRLRSIYNKVKNG